jgi:Carboxypeptidase regulatory-like domain/TonB dependent receptor-like, beta-barrel
MFRVCGRRVLPRRVVSIGAFILVLTLFATSHAAAQAVYGSIAGTVTDESDAVLPGVTVTITSTQRQTTDTVVTNESGYFVKERLLPGIYEIKAELSGFKTAVVPTVQVSVDTQTPLSVKMSVGQLTETVEVTGGSPLLKTDRADVSTTFDQRQLTEAPVLDRNFTKFILLTPGTQQLTWQHAPSENPQGSTQTMVNGQSFSGTGYQLDGTENRDPILGIIVINPNLESIGEAKITSQNYDAEFGQATAGVVSVQTKSGTNEFHGSAFEFFQNEAFQARNPFTQPTKDSLPESKRNQFGVALGGPIIKNKSFFFGDYQGTRSSVGGSRLKTVPTALARTGNLSEYGVNFYDPANNFAQFAGGMIPSERLSDQALALLELIPLPNLPGRENGTRDNFQVSGVESFDADQFDGRVDHRLNESTNIFGRYSRGKFTRDGPTSFGVGGGEALGSLGGVSDVKNQSLAIGVDKTLSSSLLADFRFGWFEYDVNVLPADFGTTPAADAGIPGLNLDTTFTSGLPSLFIGGDNNTGPSSFEAGMGLEVNRCNCPLEQNEKQWQAVGNVTKLLGNHTFKFGIDIRRAYNLRVPSDNHRSGELTFSANRTSLNGTGGLSLATFLLGDVTYFRRYVSPNTNARERQWRQFYYAQDTWRVTPKLTLNYGLRLDVINPQTVNEPGNGGWLDLTTGKILVGGVGDVDLAGNVENRLNWAPRLGAAYQLDEKTVIRGGFGRTYDIGVFGSLFGHSVTQNLPVLSVQEIVAPSNFDRVFTLTSGPPPPQFPPVPSNGELTLPNGVFTRALPPKQRPPSVDAFNVTVQRQLSDVMAVEVGYVGNRGRHAFVGDGPAVNVNDPTLQGYPNVPRDQRRPFFSGAFPTNVGGYGGAFGWTQGIDFFCNCGENSYDSLQTRFTRRFKDGYSYQMNYTWQKAEQNDGSYFFYDPNLNQGLTGWDRTHTFNLILVYELPFGKEKKWGSDWTPITDIFLGGWQFNASQTFQSGIPFDVSYAGAGGDRDVGPNRPNISGEITINGGRDEYFDGTAIGDSGSPYTRPAIGTFGNMERNSLRGPGYRRTDASMFKRFAVGGTRALEFRVEAVNLFNNVNLGNPDTEIGSPGSPRPNAGRINSTAYFNADLQRNFQFAVKFQF